MSFDRIIIIIIIVVIIIVLYNLWNNKPEYLTTESSNLIESSASNFLSKHNNESEIIIPIPLLQHFWMMETIYMREYIIRSVHQLDSQQDLLERLQQNASKIADQITKLYPPILISWQRLFMNHIERFRQVVAAVITYDGPTYDEYSYAWAKNSVLIAAELNKVNPMLSFDELKKLWMSYLEQIEEELRSIQKQKPGLHHFDETMKLANELSGYIVSEQQK